MPLGYPRMVTAQSVLTFASPIVRESGRDDLLVAGLRAEFQTVVSKPMALPGGPPQIAPLVLASRSAQVTIGPSEASFTVGLFGDFVTDHRRALEYVRRKTGVLCVAMQNADVEVLVLGVLVTMQFSTGSGGAREAIEQLAEFYEGDEAEGEEVADLFVRAGVGVDNLYYVTTSFSNYETRTFQRPAMPGASVVTVHPWEGDVSDSGVQMTIDVNNRLEARRTQGARQLDPDRIDGIFELLGRLVDARSHEIMETGRFHSANLMDVGNE